MTDRFRVASEPEAKGYPASLVLSITSPPKYVLDYAGRLGNDGHWKGPRAQATLRPSLGGEATLGWSAGVYRAPAAPATFLANRAQSWAVVAQGVEPVERRVGGRDAGAIASRWVLTQGSVMAGEARYEAGLLIPICGRTLLVNVSALSPSGDSAGGSMGFGEYVIEGMKPTEWNRIQVLETFKGMRLEGNLPAARVTAARRGRTIAGAARDCNRKPLAGQAVSLERQSGARWTRVAGGKTTATGTYSLRARGAGTYRVVAGDRRSAVVRIG
ncbi:MAG TPA: hypothetical protein VML35_01530 [Gaiellaceae bacterium]|nr:hypothetical protein [Gaiellaceae bacterium]